MSSAKAGASRSVHFGHAALAGAFAAFCALAGLFSLPPLDRDEARFAQATAQMLETGDYINIRFQGAERNKKPAGIYWLQAASVTTFSSAPARDIWAYRIPSLIGAILAAVFTYFAGARLYGPRTGLLAAFLLGASPILAAEGSIAKTDAALLAAIAAAQAAFIHIEGRRRNGFSSGWTWPLIFWLALAAGTLIKGPIIALVVGLTGAALVLRERTFAPIRALRPITGIILLIMMIAPWAAAISSATDGRFFSDAVGGDMIAKLGAAQEGHSGPPGYYLVLVWALLWPAAAFIPAGLRMAIADRQAWPSYFLLSWLLPAWAVFEFTATKLPHYTLPLYPALAIMAGHGILSGAAQQWVRLTRIGAVIYAVIGVIITVLIPVLAARFGPPPLFWPATAGAALIAFGTGIAALSAWRGDMFRSVAAAIITSAATAYILLNGIAPRLEALALSSRANAAVERAHIHPLKDGARPAALAGYYEPSAVFLLGTDTVLTDGKGAARALVNGRVGVAVVAISQRTEFLRTLAASGGSVRKIAEIKGLNYSNGDKTVLIIYATGASTDKDA